MSEDDGANAATQGRTDEQYRTLLNQFVGTRLLGAVNGTDLGLADPICGSRSWPLCLRRNRTRGATLNRFCTI